MSKFSFLFLAKISSALLQSNFHKFYAHFSLIFNTKFTEILSFNQETKVVCEGFGTEFKMKRVHDKKNLVSSDLVQLCKTQIFTELSS